ncbi:MAG: hypothetical protein Kow0010_11210 [Dehalococcoidia bacterium]
MTDVDITIPVLPVARLRALRLLANAEPAIEDLEMLVNADPALMAAALRAANSAHSAPATRVRTSREAIVRLGTKNTRRIVLAATLETAFDNLAYANLDLHELWRHLIGCAIVADDAATAGAGHSEAFTAGLLHDVGRLAMAEQDPRRYAEVVAAARAGAPALDAERSTFGLTHIEWGQAVARAWDLSEDLVDAIGGHHTGRGNGLAALLVDVRARLAGAGIGDGVVLAPEPSPQQAPHPSDALLRDIAYYSSALRLGA